MKQRLLLVSILSMHKRNKDYLCDGKPQLPLATHSWMLMVSIEKYSEPGMVAYTISSSLRRLRQGCSMFEGSRDYTGRLVLKPAVIKTHSSWSPPGLSWGLEHFRWFISYFGIGHDRGRTKWMPIRIHWKLTLETKAM